jgi:hypothetical protein
MKISFVGFRIQDQIAVKLFRNSLSLKHKTKVLAMEGIVEINAVLRLQAR